MDYVARSIHRKKQTPPKMKKMNKKLVFVLVSLVVILGLAFGYNALEKRNVREITFEELFDNPNHYNDRTIVIEGFFFHGWETIVLSEKLEPSGLAEGHLVPQGSMMWVEGGIPQDILDTLYSQQMMGPEERYGKIRIKGQFEHGGTYGHLGSHDSQIKPTEIELLQWSP